MVIVSIVLAGLVLAHRPPYVLWVATGFCALATVADLAELARQIDRSETALAVVAAAVTVTHLSGAGAGLVTAHEPA